MCILSGDLMVVFLGHFMGFNEILMSISRQISPGFNWDIYIYYIYNYLGYMMYNDDFGWVLIGDGVLIGAPELKPGKLHETKPAFACFRQETP
jgi:hypothetical protein